MLIVDIKKLLISMGAIFALVVTTSNPIPSAIGQIANAISALGFKKASINSKLHELTIKAAENAFNSDKNLKLPPEQLQNIIEHCFSVQQIYEYIQSDEPMELLAYTLKTTVVKILDFDEFIQQYNFCNIAETILHMIDEGFDADPDLSCIKQQVLCQKIFDTVRGTDSKVDKILTLLVEGKEYLGVKEAVNSNLHKSNISVRFESQYRIAIASVKKAERERELGNIKNTLDYYTQAEQIYKDMGDNLRRTKVLMSMCVLENILENNCQKAKDHYDEARRLFMESGDRRDYTILSRMGAIASRWGMYDDARTYYKRAAKGCIKGNDFPTLANVYRLRGIMEGKPKLQNIDVARNYLKKAESIYINELDDLDGQARVYQAFGDIGREHMDYISAEKNYEKAYIIYKEMNNLSQMSILVGELCRICALLGDKKGEQKWSEEIKTLYDEIPEETRIYIDDCLKEAGQQS